MVPTSTGSTVFPDIVTVERLGLLEQSIICGEGTDPPGLLAAIGDYLPAEIKAVIGDT